MGEMVWKGASIGWPKDATLPELVDGNAERDPDGIILIDAISAQEVSNSELAALYQKAARGLAKLGFGRGDCLCTLMPNSLAWYVAALAAQSLGGAISGINPVATPAEIARQISRVPAKAILAFPPALEAARQFAATQDVPIVLATQADEHGLPSLFEIDGNEFGRERRCFPDDPALLPFSSGTTGLPKPVVVTHRNLVAGGRQVSPMLKIARGDRLLGLAPLFHIVGPGLFAAALVTGAVVVVVPRFEPALILDIIEKFGVTHAPVMSPVLRALAYHPAAKARDFTRLKAVIGSGAPLSALVQAEVAQRFGCPVIQVYGMTESSSAITADDPAEPTPGCVGRPVPLSQIRIIDPLSGAPLPAERDGEIQFAGPNVMQGYLGLPAETAKVIGADGWLRTGDIGRIDAHGRLFITGRIKELIKVNSGQVAPAELELILCGHPQVAEAAVIGRPNAYCGEVPVAFLVLNELADPFAVVDWVNDQVIRYKRIRAAHVVDELPRNAIGKIDRTTLAQLDQNLSSGMQGARQ